MALMFDRDPWGWVHPFYRRRHPNSLLGNWDDFIRPAMDTIARLNNLMEMGMGPIVMPSSPFVISKDGQNHDKYEVKLDVQQFAPEELEVKIVDNFLVIEGKHEEKQDEHGFISRHFLRKYQLPSDVKPENITCDLSSDGVLQISAPRMIENRSGNEKVIPITYTGQPTLRCVEAKDPQ